MFRISTLSIGWLGLAFALGAVAALLGRMVVRWLKMQSDARRKRGSDIAIAEAVGMVRLVLDYIPQRIFWKDTNLRFLGCNIPFAVDAGFDSTDAIIGKADTDLPWKSEAAKYQADDKRVISTGIAMFNYEEKQNHPDGRVVWLRTSKVPLRDNDGRIVGVMGTYEDITARKEAEQALRTSEERYRTLSEATLDFIFIVSKSHVVEYINTPLARAALTTPENIEGRHLEDVLPATSQAGAIRLIESVLANGAPASHELRIPFPTKALWLNIQLVPINDSTGKPSVVMGVGRDITTAKIAQEQLQKTLRKLETSNRELEQFAYVASHDLQEPLRMISSYTQLLARRYRDKLDEDGRDFVDYAVEGATRMQRLIADLLSFSRITTKGLPFAPVDLQSVVDEVKNTLHLLIAERKTDIHVEGLPVIIGDQSQLERLFQNLIENAIKFASEADPKISITAENALDEWVIKVRDNGIGFDPAYRERIFVIFKRLHSRKDFPGTGIGLAICKRIVERHGGTISAESRPGKGATFTITLPKLFNPEYAEGLSRSDVYPDQIQGHQ